jgi:hypothetical protein
VREASEEASRIAKKLEVERQEKRDIVRQARKERADLVKDLTVVKSLQSEFEKVGNRRTRQAESSEKQARAEQGRLVENLSACRKLVEDERKEKREIIRQSRNAVAELCGGLEVAKLQQKELETLGRRATRQVDGLKLKKKKALEKLSEADMERRRMANGIMCRAQKRKLEKQTERRTGVMGGGSAMSSTDTARHSVKLLEAEAARYTCV